MVVTTEVSSVRNAPARHFSTFSFLAVNPEYSFALKARARKLIEEVARDDKHRGHFVLAQEDMGDMPSNPFRQETSVRVTGDEIRVVVMPGDALAQYADPTVVSEGVTQPTSIRLRDALADYIDAATQYSAGIVVEQMMRPATDFQRLGAPKIATPDDLHKILMQFGSRTQEESFHRDGVKGIFVAESPFPVLFSERNVPVLRNGEKPIRTLREGEVPDGRNIPANEVHRPEKGQVAIWDAETTAHSRPALCNVDRPFTRFEYLDRTR